MATANAIGDLFTLGQISERLQLSPATLRRLAKEEGFPIWRMHEQGSGRHYAYWSEVEAWFRRRRKEPVK